jgi:hypothetical protein
VAFDIQIPGDIDAYAIEAMRVKSPFPQSALLGFMDMLFLSTQMSQE